MKATQTVTHTKITTYRGGGLPIFKTNATGSAGCKQTTVTATSNLSKKVGGKSGSPKKSTKNGKR